MGLDIDLGNAIADRLGLKPVWVEQSFEQLIPSLDTGRIDVGASGMTDIPSRRDKTDFVDYFATGVQLFTLAPAPAGLTQPADLCGKAGCGQPQRNLSDPHAGVQRGALHRRRQAADGPVADRPHR